nr:hypothetical protein [Tanacetum cinerariifolium]
MLAPGNYVQWKSTIKRYIDTKPNHELIHYCLKNLPYKFTWADKEVLIFEGSSVTTTETYMENYKNVLQDICDQLNAKAEAVQIILTGIDNDIYSIVDACPNVCEIWKAIERLKQAIERLKHGESINIQDLETNLYWEFRKFTSRDGESLESYYSRFYKMMNELVRNQCFLNVEISHLRIMATTIEQQTALDESLVPSSQRAFQVTADVPEIHMQEFWATAKLHHTSIRFKIDTKKSVLNLEAFREMLHISPRIPNQPFADLPIEEEVLDFLRFLGHSQDIRYLTDVNVNKLYQPWRSFASVINKCLTGKSSGVEHKSQKRSNEMNYPRFTKVIIDYFMTYACAMGEAAPKPKASARKKKGDSASSTTTPTPTPTTTTESTPRLSVSAKGKQPLRATTLVEPTDLQRTEAIQLKIALKRSRQETHISQQSGSGTGEGTGSKPGVPDVPSDDSEEELSWKSSDDEEVGSHEEGKESNDDSDDGSDKDSEVTIKSGAGKDGDDDDDEDNDDDDEEQETASDDKETKETGKGGDEVRERGGESEEEKQTSEEEEVSFDLIPRTPEDSEKESDDEEEQESRLSEEARIREEEDAEELYRDVNINQGRGLQITQSVEDTHVILTPVNPDDPQESSSIVSLVPPTPIMTPSTIATITTSGEAPIPPPIIPSIILEILPTFNLLFHFEERLRLLETSFNEYRQTNQVVGAVSAIPDIVHQYMDQQMKEAVREAVQIQTNQLQDSLQRENDEFLRNIDENIKNVLKGLVKTQVLGEPYSCWKSCQGGNIKGEWRYLIPAEPQFITTCSYPNIKTSKSRLPLL